MSSHSRKETVQLPVSLIESISPFVDNFISPKTSNSKWRTVNVSDNTIDLMDEFLKSEKAKPFDSSKPTLLKFSIIKKILFDKPQKYTSLSNYVEDAVHSFINDVIEMHNAE